eukprot:395340-Prorocentrum_minimum.AAC.2
MEDTMHDSAAVVKLHSTATSCAVPRDMLCVYGEGPLGTPTLDVDVKGNHVECRFESRPQTSIVVGDGHLNLHTVSPPTCLEPAC